MRLEQKNKQTKQNKTKQNKKKTKKKKRNIGNNICEHMLISNLKVTNSLKITNSLKVDFTEFAWAISWLPSFYF